MRKSVMKSMIAGSLAVLIISFIIMMPVFFQSMKSDAIRENYIELESSIEHVKPLARMSLTFNTQKMDRLFNESMVQFSYFTKSNILFFNTNGEVIWAENGTDVEKVKKCVSKVLSVMHGDTIKGEGFADELYSMPTISVAEYVENEYGEKSWVVLCTRKTPNVTKQYKTVIYELLIMELAALIFMAAFLYVFSHTITRPLKKINQAVTDFSRGHFERKVEYHSENELGQLAQNINKMADSIENLENMRSGFVSDVSHELRTPMTTISGFVEGILDGTIPENKKADYLKIVLSESRRLSRLVNDLLSISRMDSGKISITKTDFNITELAKIVIIKFEKAITEKKIDVQFEIESDKCMVNGDVDGFTQVITNLVHNAVKFTNEGGKITMRIHTHNRKCLFSIENTGSGIEEEKLNYIWQRFYKTDNSRSSDRSGVGLGLYIVKKIIDRNGETITVTSKPEQSTIFTFTITIA